ncbi:MAG: DUF2617 family protein [Chloroflexota bacterium]
MTIQEHSLKAVIQRPHDLVLAVSRCGGLPETQGLAQASFSHGAWQVNFVIIGESHHITVRRDSELVLEEMLACVSLPERTAYHTHAFTDLQSHHHVDNRYQVYVWTSPDIPDWNWKENMLSFVFPVLDDMQPKTVIRWVLHGNVLIWQTLHTYMLAGAPLAVLSSSEILLSRK